MVRFVDLIVILVDMDIGVIVEIGLYFILLVLIVCVLFDEFWFKLFLL